MHWTTRPSLPSSPGPWKPSFNFLLQWVWPFEAGCVHLRSQRHQWEGKKKSIAIPFFAELEHGYIVLQPPLCKGTQGAKHKNACPDNVLVFHLEMFSEFVYVDQMARVKNFGTKKVCCCGLSCRPFRIYLLKDLIPKWLYLEMGCFRRWFRSNEVSLQEVGEAETVRVKE